MRVEKITDKYNDIDFSIPAQDGLYDVIYKSGSMNLKYTEGVAMLSGGKFDRFDHTVVVMWKKHDRLKELKQAEQDGAFIECRPDQNWYPKGSGWNDKLSYRIKGDVSIELWNAQKETFKRYWKDEISRRR